MVFGKGKITSLRYGDNKISQVDSYTYLHLGVNIHKSGKIKYSVKDRIAKASRAKNMIKVPCQLLGILMLMYT